MKKSEEKKTKSVVSRTALTRSKTSLGRRNKNRGSEYERRIAKELTDLGFDVVTSRSESKSMDANKVDLIDRSNKCPVKIQLKRTSATPNYFKIREESTIPNKEFALI